MGSRGGFARRLFAAGFARINGRRRRPLQSAQIFRHAAATPIPSSPSIRR